MITLAVRPFQCFLPHLMSSLKMSLVQHKIRELQDHSQEKKNTSLFDSSLGASPLSAAFASSVHGSMYLERYA